MIGEPIEPGDPDSKRQRLRRALKLRDLVLYGVIVIQPVAPMSPFGTIQKESGGRAATAILMAMVAMLLTAVSYGRMAAAYPSAGSAFTYVGKEIHPILGFVTGWGMVMDYVLNPMICVIWCSNTIKAYAHIPFWVLAPFFALLFTGLNLRGIKMSSRFNALLALGMSVVIGIFLLAAVRYLLDPGVMRLDLGEPFRGGAWDGKALFRGASVAVVTFIGFDGISALAEEVENPRRNVMIATVLTCLTIGALATVEVYVAQLISAVAGKYPVDETAFSEVAGFAGGQGLSIAILVTLVVANVGSGSGAHLGAARLLYGMGRSRALPRSFFGSVHPRHSIPRNNVILVGAVALVGAFALNHRGGGYEMGVQLLNFGALIAFAGVHLAALWHYFVRRRRRTLGTLLVPLVGGAICVALLITLSPYAKIAGFVWLAVGVAFAAWRTKGFRERLILDLPPDGEADTILEKSSDRQARPAGA